ncbi:hypothetical protein [Natrinema sp. 74]
MPLRFRPDSRTGRSGGVGVPVRIDLEERTVDAGTRADRRETESRECA